MMQNSQEDNLPLIFIDNKTYNISSIKESDLDNKTYNISSIKESEITDLEKIANKNIKDLVNESPQLLVFPNNLYYYGDGIGEQCILTIIYKDSGRDLSTGNILGFIGVNDTKVRIKSRFAENDDNDYFLHYMLQKVLCINLFDYKFGTSQESDFDFRVYLFPYYLKKALNQGLFRQYKKIEYNNANVRGAINISRHIRMNIPFRGSVAFDAREHSYDNDITQLIRHTIEYIKTNPLGQRILQSDGFTKECVRQIIQATPSYSASKRQSIVYKNLNPISHPYYSEYSPLQKICLQILRHEGIKYGNKPDNIWGVLFDVAWLWEEYLNTILKEEGFEHPKNKKSEGGLPMFKDDAKDYRLYPDFYKNDFILDAKYKSLNRGVGREDRYQMVTYMHCTKCQKGAFVYPLGKEEPIKTMELEGYGGTIQIIPFYVPQITNTNNMVNDWSDFCRKIKESENFLRDKL